MNRKFPGWFDEILRDPQTGERLERDRQGYSGPGGKCYPVESGVLSAVFPETLTGDDEHWNRFYDWFAPFYEWTQRIGGRMVSGSKIPPEELWRQDVVSRLGLWPGARVLEVSPGPGMMQRLVREQIGECGELVALDLSRSMLRVCEKRGDLNACLVHGNGQYLPFADDSFDVVFHFGGVNLFNDPARTIAQFVRVAKKGGIVSWGDEGFSPGYPDGMKKRMLVRMNPGFLRSLPAVPETLGDVKTYEVFFGMGYLNVGKKT